MLRRLSYKTFPIILNLSVRFSNRLAPTGRLFVWALIAAATLGIDTRQTLAYQLAALFFSMLLVAALISIYWRPKLEIRRKLPEYVTNGEMAYYTLTIINNANKVERSLLLRDSLVEPRPSYVEFLRAKADTRNRARNWFDRAVGFPRWVELVCEQRGADLGPVALPVIPANGRISLRLELRPLRRGHLTFSAVTLYRPDPLGLFFAQHRVPTPGHLISLPRRYPVPTVKLCSRRRYQHGGTNLAMAVGDAQEFMSVRDYRPGDPLRHIHWRSFAKTGSPIVKQYQDEYFDRHALIVDSSLKGQSPDRFEAVMSLAASFSTIARPNDSLFDMVFVGDRVWQLAAGRGLADTAQILRFLAEATPADEDGFDRLQGYLCGHMGQFASVVIIFGCWNEARLKLIRELKPQIPFWVIRVLSDNESHGPLIDDETVSDEGINDIRSSNIREDLAKLHPKVLDDRPGRVA